MSNDPDPQQGDHDPYVIAWIENDVGRVTAEGPYKGRIVVIVEDDDNGNVELYVLQDSMTLMLVQEDFDSGYDDNFDAIKRRAEELFSPVD